MKKVVFLGFNSFREHKRGIENVIEFQTSVLDDWCYYIHWGKYFKVYKFKNMICVSLPPFSIQSLFFLSLIVRRIATRNKDGLFIHSHNSLMSVFLYRSTDLFTVHDGLYYQQKSSNANKWRVAFFRLLEQILYKRCRQVHFISEFTKCKSLYPLSAKNFTMIYNTSTFESYIQRFTPNELVLNTQFPYLKGKEYCFIVRSLEERARIDLVIETAYRQKDIFFIVAGKGPLADILQEKIDRMNLSNIKLLGFVADNVLFNLYALSTFVMVPAEYGEGFGLPIIEAYLFNKPVIASRRCAIPEVIINDRYLFENNVDSVLSCIEFCKSCKREDFSEYYQKFFSREIILKQYKQLYKRCM